MKFGHSLSILETDIILKVCVFVLLGTGHKVQEGVGRKNQILKGTVLVAHPS